MTFYIHDLVNGQQQGIHHQIMMLRRSGKGTSHFLLLYNIEINHVFLYNFFLLILLQGQGIFIQFVELRVGLHFSLDGRSENWKQRWHPFLSVLLQRAARLPMIPHSVSAPCLPLREYVACNIFHIFMSVYFCLKCLCNKSY